MPDLLPPSELNQDDYPRGPNGMALFVAHRIAELEAALADHPTRDARRPINKHLHTLRGMLRWCKSRAGYTETPQDLGLID